MQALWSRQIAGILRLELKKNLLSSRALPIYLLAGAPLALMGVFVLVSVIESPPEDIRGPAGAALFHAVVFQFILRVVIYLGCVWTFMNLFRGEVLDRSLHYYFLSPVRREVLVAGKFLSAWASLTLLFGLVTTACFMMSYGVLGGTNQGWLGPAGHLSAYLLVVVLGTLGYGAVFLVVGQFLRNPVVPAVAIFLWENANIFLPSLLKKISVIFYLQSLFPVALPEGQLAVIADPVSPWLSVPGLILFTAVTLTIAGWRIRAMEIAYSAD